MKKQIIDLVNKAMLQVEVPTVSAQKKEFYKAGVRDLIKQINIQLSKLPKELSNAD